MMVKPTMLQATVQRSQDISNIRQNEDNKGMVAQSNIQHAVKKETMHKAEYVLKKENAEYHEQRHDAKEKGKNEYFMTRKTVKKSIEDDEEDDGRVIIKKKSSYDWKI